MESVFLPSVNNDDRPLPAKYYAVYSDGELKTRGIEMRQRSTPQIVYIAQENAIKLVRDCTTIPQILQRLPLLCQLLRQYIYQISTAPQELLSSIIRIGKDSYVANNVQSKLVKRLRSTGVQIMAGQNITFIMTTKGEKVQGYMKRMVPMINIQQIHLEQL